MRFLGILTLFVFSALSLKAEYRVFKLRAIQAETGQSRIIHSTLDQHQYPRLHPLPFGEKLVYETSWMCWNPGGEDVPYCDPPKKYRTKSSTDVKARLPASAPITSP